MKMTNLVSRLARRGLDLMPQIKQSLHEFNVLVMLMFCNINSSSNILWIISQNSVQVFHLLSVLLIMLLEATEGVMDGLSFQVMLQSLHLPWKMIAIVVKLIAMTQRCTLICHIVFDMLQLCLLRSKRHDLICTLAPLVLNVFINILPIFKCNPATVGSQNMFKFKKKVV